MIAAMDGIHDLGGMHGFGRVEREPDEPVFHAPWEAVMLAIQRTTRGRLFTLDEFRHAIERIPPARYLASSYYERWCDGISRLMVEKGVLGPEEIESRAAFFARHRDVPATAALPGAPPAGPAMPRFEAETSFREPAVAPRFAVGQAVVTRRQHPTGHTRLPRYARGRRGVIVAHRGTHVFPDANAHGQGEQPRPLYTVRFDGRELWGDAAEPNQAVHLDLWEPYLEPADGP